MARVLVYKSGIIDTQANLDSSNPILELFAFGYASDAGILKIGDGHTTWGTLPGIGLGGSTGTPSAIDNQNDDSSNGTIKVWEGTQVQYDALSSYSSDTLYIVDNAEQSSIVTLDYMPIGFNMPWWSDTLPSSKYLFMEGQSLTAYPAAQAVFGANLPDLRGRVMVHKSTDAEFNAIGKTSGSKDLQQHKHTITVRSDGSIVPNNIQWGSPTGNTNSFNSAGTFGSQTGGGSDGCSWVAGTGNSGNIQPSIVCRYIAKVIA
jgi:hypothetical protein